LESLGDSAQAAAAYKRERELARELLKINPRDPALLLVVAQSTAALGDLVRARALLASLIKMAPTDPQILFDIAVIYEFRLHDRDQSLKWLAKAIENGQPWRTIDRSPYLRELRQDVRFQQLRRGR
jgi:tetratricopeptide (TPR) repeat protein